MYKLLLIGSGAREHAIAYKIKQSPLPHHLWVWPSNPIISLFTNSTGLDVEASLQDVRDFCLKTKIDVVIVGPETPLSQGISDILAAAGISCFGPSQLAAQVESSKAFTKELLKSAKIPTAEFELSTNSEITQSLAFEFLEKHGGVVLKASGLAAGKGVFVCFSPQQIQTAIKHLYGPQMKTASQTVVIEQVLVGRESSYFNFIGNEKITSLGFAVDYKRLQNKDQGPNTGGMGCYTPVPWIPKNADKIVEEKIVIPFLNELSRRQIQYTGWLYTGLMWNNDEPYVVEFNCRLGDPEAQILAVADKSDWLERILFHVGKVNQTQVHDSNYNSTVGVVLTSTDYPFAEFRQQDCGLFDESLFSLEPRSNSKNWVFAASIKKHDEMLISAKGRVLTVIGQGSNFEEARNCAYQKVREIQIQWPNSHCRTDIAENLTMESR